MRKACAMAIDWWLEEGKNLVEFGCPAWVFYAREVLERETMKTLEPWNHGDHGTDETI